MTDSKKLGLFALIALVISSSIGAGVFDLTRKLAESAPPGPALLAWLIVGVGILLMIVAINFIVRTKPELDGLLTYAEEGFGRFWGFASGWGYWLSAWLGNVAFATILMQAIGRLGGHSLYSTFFDANDAPFWITILITSVIMWLLMLLVTRGIESASFINAVVMVAKLIPLAVFMIIAFVMFKVGVFTSTFWAVLATNAEGAITGVTKQGFVWKDVWGQIQGCFMVLIWVYVGVEGATVFTSRARDKSEAAKATVFAFIGLTVIYIFISMLPYGLIPYKDLASLGSPAVGEILQAKVGSWGMYLMNAGLAISVLGSWLSWTLLPVETTTIMAQRKMLPGVFGRLNKNGSPTFALVLTTLLCQLLLFTVISPHAAFGNILHFTIAGASAYDFAFSLCSSAILLSWMFIGFYASKLGFQVKKYGIALVGAIAGLFQIAMMYLAGWQYFLLVLLGFLPGIILFFVARSKTQSETGEKAYTTVDLVSAALVALAGVVTIVLLVTKVVTI